MRICVIYDCLFPYTVGGGERWYRNLAEAMAKAGHDVTYLTRRQWDAGESPEIPGVNVVPVSPGGELYADDGRRLIGPPVRFGLGVFKHLVVHRRSYDVVHTCAFPFFSLPAARVALFGSRVEIGVDWFEVWTSEYWRGYLGRVGGSVGFAIQRVAARMTPRAFVFSELHARRLAAQGLRGPSVRLAGLHPDPTIDPAPPTARPTVVFAGRQIPEKRARVLPAAIALARQSVPDLRGKILGDGPEHGEVLAEIARLDLVDAIEAPGFVSSEEVCEALGSALCLVLPSSREGYGLVVVEAALRGTPSVVVAGPDNAATELIEEGENGFIAASVSPDDLARSVVRAFAEGEELRARTLSWAAANHDRLALETSLERVLAAYGAPTDSATASAKTSR